MTTTTLKGLISDNNTYGIKGIQIPRIQRAYAQGRTDYHAVKTRERFLSELHNSLKNNGMTLDFIYGNIRKDGYLIPLDGQQRLTTLWLLHWYADNKEDIGDSSLSRFSYDTRYSARDFLEKLVTFKPDLSQPLSRQIVNQGWFPMEWMNDPTVAGMLTMLDEIQKRFADVDDLWNKLDSIDFYFKDIEEMQLTDEIYIKMNSRGKPLTDFEHFKAELLKVIRDEGGEMEEAAKRIGLKIDREWTDMLWVYRDSENLVDNGFLRFFRMISRILIYKADKSYSEFQKADDFELLDKIYRHQPKNVEYLERAFDCFADIHKSEAGNVPDDHTPVGVFFSKYLSDIHEKGKVVVPKQIKPHDLLKAIVEDTAFKKNTADWIVMFYSFLLYLMNLDKIREEDFRRRLRIVVNLLKNSKNEVVDNPNGDAGNRMPAILKQLESIIISGVISENVEVEGSMRQNFNALQMEEERQKLIFTTQQPEVAEQLFKLEDHYLLEGKVSVVGYENVEYYQPFIDLFEKCDRDKIDCAMLAICDYSQRLNKWFIQLGSGDEGEVGNEAWYSLFHPSGKNTDFEHTKDALRTILRENPSADEKYLDDKALDYTEKCRESNYYDWRYYYITYPAFRYSRFGKYTMTEEAPYEMVALYTKKKESSNAYQCMLQGLIDEDAVARSAEWYDVRSLTFKKGLLTCYQDAFVSNNLNDDTERARFIIPQNEEGIDIKDRILFFKEHRKDEDSWVYPE